MGARRPEKWVGLSALPGYCAFSWGVAQAGI
jgi:hypothetical protein